MHENHIPYRFMPIPYEFFSEDFIKDQIMIRFIVCMMHRISPYPTSIPLKNSHKQLSLDSFEFMYGRNKFSKEAGILEKNARTRLKQLIGLGYVEEVTSKKASNYTVYRLVKEAFKQNSGQLSDHVGGQQNGHPSGHKQETKSKEKKNIKGTVNDKKVDSSLSYQQKMDIVVLLDCCESKSLEIGKKSIERWIRKYNAETILTALSLLFASRNSVRNHEAWMETAMSENFVGKNRNSEINR